MNATQIKTSDIRKELASIRSQLRSICRQTAAAQRAGDAELVDNLWCGEGFDLFTREQELGRELTRRLPGWPWRR
jgi:ABC-type uncharacterized transport system YnjBCD substrate-binding protein